MRQAISINRHTSITNWPPLAFVPSLMNTFYNILRLSLFLLNRFNRSTNKESLINGITIPKGLDVAVSVYAVHHNSNVWDEPEKFDPDRYIL